MSHRTGLRPQPSQSHRAPERGVLRPRAARHRLPDVEWWYEDDGDVTQPLPVMRDVPHRPGPDGATAAGVVAPLFTGPPRPGRARAAAVRAAGVAVLLLASIAAVLVLLLSPPPAAPLPHSPVRDALPTPHAPVEAAPDR